MNLVWESACAQVSVQNTFICFIENGTLSSWSKGHITTYTEHIKLNYGSQSSSAHTYWIHKTILAYFQMSEVSKLSMILSHHSKKEMMLLLFLKSWAMFSFCYNEAIFPGYVKPWWMNNVTKRQASTFLITVVNQCVLAELILNLNKTESPQPHK